MRVTLTINSGHSVDLNHTQATYVIADIKDEPAMTDFYAEAANHPSSEVRCVVATKKCLPICALEKLANDPHLDVVREVAKNISALKSFSADLFQQMIARDLGVAIELADNLSLIQDDATREKVIASMRKIGDPELQSKISQYQRSLAK